MAGGLGDMGEFDDGLGPVEGGESTGDAGFVNSNSDASDEWGNTSSGFDEAPTDEFSAPDDGNNEWGTFEEADYGFPEEPANDDWSDLADSAGDGEGGGTSSIFGIISDIFNDN